MKRTILHLALLMQFSITLTFNSYGQNKTGTGPFIYSEIGVATAKIPTFKVTVNAIFNRNDFISLGYYYNWRPATQLPADFDPGFDWGRKNELPVKTSSMCGIMYGKVIFTKSRFVRYVLKGGISIGTVTFPSGFKEATVTHSWGLWRGDHWSSNYTWYDEKKIVAGLIVNPTIEFPLTRGLGISAGLYGNLVPLASTAGIDVSIIFGRVRGRKQK